MVSQRWQRGKPADGDNNAREIQTVRQPSPRAYRPELSGQLRSLPPKHAHTFEALNRF